ncbi:hypothetical protein [Pelomonas cellulosilytica]|uniref:Uncharacterized protein n=1 Tax=Pelomonas cellulosilytica TaxID=2906762 RepID=A0ABS8Y0Y3_9BURK|nr:hypothetical protein [Pelomonas sp. P8]MCE4556722.1 hypothetical protein [Pelomonas sp. P8]
MDRILRLFIPPIASLAVLAGSPPSWSVERPVPAASSASSPVRLQGKGPLRFDPPAAGPRRAEADYQSCSNQPSPDGLADDCHALLDKPVHRPRR